MLSGAQDGRRKVNNKRSKKAAVRCAIPALWKVEEGVLPINPILPLPANSLAAAPLPREGIIFCEFLHQYIPAHFLRNCNA
jgi:hypothetical protein